ncbi:MAG: T9SS type A sorting domain-containing protein, partial [Saprospiraceae bacterium]|nr:T9SS type A sorting domain-containing protein [Saprospiraceae bacterium]
RYACQFPGGIDNPDELVYLLPGPLDTVKKTFDVRIVNPYHKLYGFEFAVSGLEISSIENLDPGFDGAWAFNAQQKIQALSLAEKGLKKNVLPGNLIRIHYAKLTAPEVCVGEIFNIVNEKYHRANAQATATACVPTGTSSTHGREEAPPVWVLPNPARDYIEVFFGAENSAGFSVQLINPAGQLVRTSGALAAGQTAVRIDRGGLPAGVYVLLVQWQQGVRALRVVLE